MTAKGRFRPVAPAAGFPSGQPDMLGRTAGFGQKRTSNRICEDFFFRRSFAGYPVEPFREKCLFVLGEFGRCGNVCLQLHRCARM